jgi:hypothetical protein
MSDNRNRRIGLIELTAVLSRLAHRRVSYNSLWHGCVDGKFRAEKFGSAWTVLEADVPEILKVMTATKPVRRERLKSA